MIETKSSLDVKSAAASLSAIQTHDGPFIIIDPEVGEVSSPNRAAAEQELRRRKAALRRMAA